MKIPDDLDMLRAEHGAVESAVYLDMRSGTVLYASAANREPQEKLDALCATATAVLGGADGDAGEAVSLKATEALIVHRSPSDPSEALCLVCAPDVDVSELMGSMQAVLGGSGLAGPGPGGPRMRPG